MLSMSPMMLVKPTPMSAQAMLFSVNHDPSSQPKALAAQLDALNECERTKNDLRNKTRAYMVAADVARS